MAKQKKSSAKIRREQRQRRKKKVSKRRTRGYYINKERARLMDLRNSEEVPEELKSLLSSGQGNISVEFPEELKPLFPKGMK